MEDYSAFDAHRVKHLEMIQAVVARLGTDSFLVKGWAVTISGAFLGFAIDREEWRLAVAGVVPAILFWGLDAYFLRSERLFRALHDAVRRGTPSVKPFFMAATQPAFVAQLAAAKTSRSEVALSPTLTLFYGTLVVSAVAVASVLGL